MFIVCLSMFGLSSALATPPRAFDAYVKKVADRTGRTEDEVRGDAIDSLRHEGKFADADLERIGRDERAGAGEPVELSMIDALRKSDSFRARSGLRALGEAGVAAEAARMFDAMKASPGGQLMPPAIRFKKLNGERWTVEPAVGAGSLTKGIYDTSGMMFPALMLPLPARVERAKAFLTKNAWFLGIDPKEFDQAALAGDVEGGRGFSFKVKGLTIDVTVHNSGMVLGFVVHAPADMATLRKYKQELLKTISAEPGFTGIGIGEVDGGGTGIRVYVKTEADRAHFEPLLRGLPVPFAIVVTGEILPQ